MNVPCVVIINRKTIALLDIAHYIGACTGDSETMTAVYSGRKSANGQVVDAAQCVVDIVGPIVPGGDFKKHRVEPLGDPSEVLPVAPDAVAAGTTL